MSCNLPRALTTIGIGARHDGYGQRMYFSDASRAMAALTLALVTNLAVTCHAGPDLARVIAHMTVESALDPNSIGDNTTHESGIRPATVDAAIAEAKLRLAKGHSIDAGLMQINSQNWPRFGLSVETVFSPLANTCTGVAIIKEARATERRISCIYNAGRPDCPPRYPDAIERALDLPNKSPQAQRVTVGVVGVFWRPSHSPSQTRRE